MDHHNQMMDLEIAQTRPVIVAPLGPLHVKVGSTTPAIRIKGTHSYWSDDMLEIGYSQERRISARATMLKN